MTFRDPYPGLEHEFAEVNGIKCVHGTLQLRLSHPHCESEEAPVHCGGAAI